MAYAKVSDCQSWHAEYCRLYWELNELQVIGTLGDGTPVWESNEYKAIEARMGQLVTLLGYVPAP